MAVRPIDGSELMVEIQACNWDSEQDRQRAEDLVLGMPTLTPQNEWVSVEERLPNPKQNVLAYSPKSGIAEADYADGVWMQYRWSAVMDDVTHWRLLPAPPERQEDANA